MKQIDLFRAYLKDRKSLLTQKHYINTAERYLLYLRGSEPNEQNVEEFMAFLSLKGCGARSLNRHLAALKSFFKHVLKKELMVESYRFDKRLPEWLDEEELNKYSAACETLFEKALVAIFRGAGVRVSEAASLRVDKVNHHDGYVTVMGKGGKERTIPVESEVITILDEYLQSRTDHSPLVFPRGIRVIEKIIAQIGERAKIRKRITPHVLRHSMASLHLDRGGELIDLKEKLGHENISTTSIYSHAKPISIKKRMPSLLK